MTCFLAAFDAGAYRLPSMLDHDPSRPRGAAPHGIEGADTCPACRITAVDLLRRLPREAVAELQARTATCSVAAGDVLFASGDAASAIHVLRAGRMKVRVRDRVVKICRAGEILGGGAFAAAVPHTGTLVAVDDDCHVDVIELAPGELRASVVAAVHACALAAHHQAVQAIVVSTETIARMARVLADFGCFAGEGTDDGIHIPLTLSHRRIGEILALPENAVTHILEELETRGVLYADGTGVTILASGHP